MDEAKRALSRRDVAIRFLDQGLVSGGNFLTSVVIARELGPDSFGSFALLWTIVTFGIGIQWSFVAAPLQNTRVGVGPSAEGSRFASVGLGALLLTVAMSAAGLVFVWCVEGASGRPIPIFGAPLAIFGILLQEFSRRWLLVSERPLQALVSDSVRIAVALAGILILARYRASSLQPCLLALGGAALLASAVLASDIRRSRWSLGDFSLVVREHTRIGRILLPSVMLQTMSASAPLYFIGLGSGSAAVGGYRAIVTLMSPVVSLTEALETFLPLRVRQAVAAGGGSRVVRQILDWTFPLVLLCVVYVGAVVVVGRYALSYVFGRGYADYASVLAPMCVAMVLQFVMYLCHVGLRAHAAFRAILVTDVMATTALLMGLFLWGRSPITAAICVAGYQGIKFVLLFAALRAESGRSKSARIPA